MCGGYPLPEDGRVEVTLPSEGLHIIYAELATQAATDDDVSNDLFAHISERLSVTSLLDQTPPVLASVIHEPDTNAQPNYALYDSVRIHRVPPSFFQHWTLCHRAHTRPNHFYVRG